MKSRFHLALDFLLITFDADHGLKFKNCLFVPSMSRELVIREFHHSCLAVHLGGTNMYHDLCKQFWWKGMKYDVSTFVSHCLTCQQVKAKYCRTPECYNPCLYRCRSGSMLRWILSLHFRDRLMITTPFESLLIV